VEVTTSSGRPVVSASVAISAGRPAAGLSSSTADTAALASLIASATLRSAASDWKSPRKLTGPD